MTGFDPIKFISKITLLVIANAGIATSQQYTGGSSQSNVIVDYSVIESLGPSPNVARKNLDQLSKGDGLNNLYVGPKLKIPEASRSQPPSKIDVIVLKPPRSIKKLVPNPAKKRGKGVTSTIHVNPPPKVHKTPVVRPPPLLAPLKTIKALPTPTFSELWQRPVPPPTIPALEQVVRPPSISSTKVHKPTEVRPPPPPPLLTPLKTIKALPTPTFSELWQRPAPPPPAIPALEQVVRPPLVSSTKVLTKNVPPVRPKFSKPEAKPETRVASIPSIGQPTQAETINRIEFNAGSFELNSEASETLKNLSASLEKNSALRTQLHAYASLSGGSAIKAKRLALSRALAARAYLIDRGVEISRIAVKALGHRSTSGPADRIDIILTKR
ncbi:MAG: OmpA family protein [Alphaproteobacteria bacterium]